MVVNSTSVYRCYWIFLILFFLFAWSAAEGQDRPNILTAIADDASFKYFGAYGTDWIDTPAFDRVAEQGVLFSNAYTPNAKCAPSRSILLTGRHSWQLKEAATGRQAPTEKPNVVFFLVDDLGWSDVGVYGSSLYETPNIDRFAEEGVRFTNAYASSHVCSPTRAAILTGKNPARINLTDWLPGRKDFPFQRLKNVEVNQHLPFKVETIAEKLKKHGYTTAHFGKWHLGEDPSGPLEHGFDFRIPKKWNKGWPNAGYHAPFEMEGLEGEEGDYLTDRLTDEALKYIENNRDNSFFLYLAHFAVHDPIQGRKDLVKKYKNKIKKMPDPKEPSYILEENPDSEDPLSRKELDALLDDPRYQGYKVLPNRTVKIKQHQDNPEFAGMVESMDESLGRVLSKLEELGLDENTIVIFFSDNGGMSAANFFNPNRVIEESDLDKRFSTSNLPLRAGKGWLYEGGIRVPMIVKWPQKGKQGLVVDEPVISTDFYPSIVEMLGLPVDEGQELDGKSIVPLLKGDKIDREAIYWHFPHYSNHGMQSPGAAVRSGDFKLIEYFENGTVQLFNLKEDPGEQRNLVQSNPGKVQELQTMLHEWREDIEAEMPEENPNYVEQE